MTVIAIDLLEVAGGEVVNWVCKVLGQILDAPMSSVFADTKTKSQEEAFVVKGCGFEKPEMKDLAIHTSVSRHRRKN